MEKTKSVWSCVVSVSVTLNINGKNKRCLVMCCLYKCRTKYKWKKKRCLGLCSNVSVKLNTNEKNKKCLVMCCFVSVTLKTKMCSVVCC